MIFAKVQFEIRLVCLKSKVCFYVLSAKLQSTVAFSILNELGSYELFNGL